MLKDESKNDPRSVKSGKNLQQRSRRPFTGVTRGSKTPAYNALINLNQTSSMAIGDLAPNTSNNNYMTILE